MHGKVEPSTRLETPYLMASPDGSVSVISESTIFPDTKSEMTSVRLFVSEVPMLTFNYIQMGCLFSKPELSDHDLSHLKLSLSKALSVFPPLAGRLSTDPSTGNISVSCTDAGALFVHARATSVHPTDISPLLTHFFPLRTKISYDGHSVPLAAVQVTELSNAVFIGCSVNHVVADGTSFWNFFNTFADISRTGSPNPSHSPSFPVNADDDPLFPQYIAPPDFQPTPPPMTLSAKEPTKERVFHFSRQAILALKKRANETRPENNSVEAVITVTTSGDHRPPPTDEISSFQSLCAHLWRSITRARKLPPTKTTMLGLFVDCRQRVNPKMEPLLFGNVIQAIQTTVLAGEVVSRELGWTAELLHRVVVEHDDRTVRERVTRASADPRSFQFKILKGAMILMGNSPRLPAYEADFGWGPQVAVRIGKPSTFDGQCTVFPGREGGGSMDLELTLAPEAMIDLETDPEFMDYVC